MKLRNRLQSIGYNRTVKLEWLDYTAALLKDGRSEQEIHGALTELLRQELSADSDAKRGSREKTITILLKTWVRVPNGLSAFRDIGLKLLSDRSGRERITPHWGMTIASYPFFRSVAEVTGRLLRLQSTASASQIQRRVRERVGERETVARSARYVIRAMVDWQVLKETAQKGVYVASDPIKLVNAGDVSWLVEAELHATEKGPYSLKGILGSPSLFPFRVEPARSPVFENERVELVRHAVSDELVSLRELQVR